VDDTVNFPCFASGFGRGLGAVGARPAAPAPKVPVPSSSGRRAETDTNSLAGARSDRCPSGGEAQCASPPARRPLASACQTHPHSPHPPALRCAVMWG